MALPLNSFGLLGNKDKSSEQLLGAFQAHDQFEDIVGRTSNATVTTLNQIFLPLTDPGFFLFEVFLGAWNITDGTALVLAGGFIGASVDLAGVVTLNADANAGLVDYISAAAVTNVTITKRDQTATLPAVININAVGVAAKNVIWSGKRRLVHQVTRDTIIPIGRSQVSPNRPAI